jgi:superfamily II DNA or RNA helicase
MVSKVLVYDTDRNSLIIEDLIKEIWKNRKIIVLTERKDHVMLLNMYLKNQYETITLIWDDGIWKRKIKFQQIKSWNFQVLISTWQLIWEWLDIWELDCLFLVYPFSFEGKLIQYIWRIQRTKKKQVIYDYHDKNIDYFDKLFKKRQTYYNKLEKSWRYKIIKR